jgi:hypothetical protein
LCLLSAHDRRRGGRRNYGGVDARTNITGHFQIVDPDVGLTLSAIDVQQHAVDISLVGIHVVANLGPQHTNGARDQHG